MLTEIKYIKHKTLFDQQKRFMCYVFYLC